MRLNCPNCEAQYEVPDDVIPPEGRDVQCAACGETWFQPNPGSPDAGAEDVPDAAEDPEENAAENAAENAEETVSDTRAGRRELDPDVANVLREEAAREKRTRAAPRGEPDVQDAARVPPARTDRPAPAARQASDASKISTPPDRAGTASPRPRASDPSARQGLFPDIEEINSSLAPTGGAAEGSDDASAAPSPYGGFRGGFLVAVLVALAALLIYVFAAQLGAAIPGLQGALAEYVGWIDGMRGWLNSLVSPSVPG